VCGLVPCSVPACLLAVLPLPLFPPGRYRAAAASVEPTPATPQLQCERDHRMSLERCRYVLRALSPDRRYKVPSVLL